jgi:hypothetical protein
MATTTTVNYSGAPAAFVVPAGVTSVTVDAFGAEGWVGSFASDGAPGAEATASFSVTAGQTLEVVVGGGGGFTGGFNGGGGVTQAPPLGGGGGATDVRRGACAASLTCGAARRVLVAGGGGGDDSCGHYENSGVGGGPNGGNGFTSGVTGDGVGGTGATELAAGTGGAAGLSATRGKNGSGPSGGAGGAANAGGCGGGGGGGGYYGGGGGGGGANFTGGNVDGAGGGGGGGSSHGPAGVAFVGGGGPRANCANCAGANGYVTINYLVNTATTITSSANPALPGQPVTYTATVKPRGGATGTPGGTLTFNDNGSAICTDVSMSSGTATCTTTYAAAGSHSIQAVYSGDSAFKSSTSGVLTEQIEHITTTTSVASDANPSVIGQLVTFTATVAHSSGSPTPTGTVTFTVNGLAAGCTSQQVSAGQATCTITFNQVGGYQVAAAYNGDGVYSGSSGSLTQNVELASSTVLTSSANPSVAQQEVTYTATVAPQSGPGTPTGTVDFTDGGSAIDGCAAVAVPAGQAMCSVTYRDAGPHAIEATYSGDSTFAPSADSLTQTVNPLIAPPTTTGSGGGTTPAPPSLSQLKIKPHSFRTAKKAGSHSGARITYRDSLAAVTTFRVYRRSRRGKWVYVGKFAHHDTTGTNRLRFTGRLEHRRLKPGGYKLKATASMSGKLSRTASASFVIL